MGNEHGKQSKHSTAGFSSGSKQSFINNPQQSSDVYNSSTNTPSTTSSYNAPYHNAQSNVPSQQQQQQPSNISQRTDPTFTSLTTPQTTQQTNASTASSNKQSSNDMDIDHQHQQQQQSQSSQQQSGLPSLDTSSSSQTQSQQNIQPMQTHRTTANRRVEVENSSDSNMSDAELQQFTSAYKKVSIDDFELLKVIGKGSFGKVMQVRKKSSNQIYAMKVLKKEILLKRRQILHTKTERKILEEIQNPFITGLKYAFQTSSKLYLIMEYFSGGELFFHLKNIGRFSEERSKFYAAEIILAIECLHSHNIVYRDLKPENVLLDSDGHIRLTDFGLAKDGVANYDIPDKDLHLTRTFCGTPEYLAPEMIARVGYGLCVDWWSLGTLLYEMLTGLPPFYDQNIHIMYEKIVRAKLILPNYLSNNCKSLLAGLLERDPKRRLGYNNDGTELRSHPWFSDIDWNALYNKKLQPPFKPKNTEGKLDTQNVDDEFKRLPAADTPSQSLRTQVDFPGFTYQPASVTNQQHTYLR